jgi:NADH-quinone oxidoreductase subunit J
MADLLFYIFAALALVCGFMVVNPFIRNPVTNAMFLVLTLAWLAALFVLLQAFFIAAIQILVYAGAVMVLFLFVIMLLDLKAEAHRHFSRFGLAAGMFGVLLLGGLLLLTILRSGVGKGLQPKLQGSTVSLGKTLFTDYLLPFEVVSLILLVGMVGVVLLSKREIK